MLYSLCLDWNSLVKDFIIIEGVKVVDCYRENYLLCCLDTSNVYNIVLEYDRSTIFDIYQEENKLIIDLRQLYTIFEDSVSRGVKNFRLEFEFLDLEVY